MKKITFLLVALLMISASETIHANTSTWLGYWGSPNYTEGDVSGTFLNPNSSGYGGGTPDDPYLISSAADLAKLAQNLKNGIGDNYAGKYFRLMVDIDLNHKDWFPIGIGGKVFKGHFDGNNHNVSNLKIIADDATAADGCGLFGKAETGSIKNIGIKNAVITGNSKQNIGGLLGNCGISVSNCFIDNVEITSSNTNIGGLIGKCWENTFTNCYATNAKLNAASTNSRGGIIGSIGGSGNRFINCYAANINFSKTNDEIIAATYLGTLAGDANGEWTQVTFTNCYADVSLCGTISGSKAQFKRGDGTAVTIDNSNKINNEFIKSLDAFKSGEISYSFNQYPQNNQYWSIANNYPCYADETNAQIYKLNATVYTNDGVQSPSGYAKGDEPITGSSILSANIAAIILGEGCDIPQTALNTLGNANTLKYTGTLSYEGNNTIQDGEKAMITLTDGIPFYCPIAIENADITYTRNFAEGWNTMCLPFPYTIANENEDIIEKLISGTETSVSFEYITDKTVANTPYLINIKETGEKEFSATGVTIPASGTMANETIDGFTFKGLFVPTSLTSGYGLVLDNATQEVMFKKIPSTGYGITPFRAYLTSATVPSNAPLKVIHGDGGATNVEINTPKETFQIYAGNECINIIAGKAQNIKIFGIDGRLMKTIQLNEGPNTIHGINKGIYLINNQKVLVK